MSQYKAIFEAIRGNGVSGDLNESYTSKQAETFLKDFASKKGFKLGKIRKRGTKSNHFIAYSAWFEDPKYGIGNITLDAYNLVDLNRVTVQLFFICPDARFLYMLTMSDNTIPDAVKAYSEAVNEIKTAGSDLYRFPPELYNLDKGYANKGTIQAYLKKNPVEKLEKFN